MASPAMTSTALNLPAFTEFYKEHKGEYSKLLREKMRGGEVTAEQLAAAETSVKTGLIVKPILYAVTAKTEDPTKQGKLVAYLLGVRHVVSQAMMDHPVFRKVVSASSKLLGEENFGLLNVTKESFPQILKDHQSRIKGVYQTQDPFNVSMDFTLYGYALNQDIPYGGLRKFEELVADMSYMHAKKSYKMEVQGSTEYIKIIPDGLSPSETAKQTITRAMPAGTILREASTTKQEKEIEDTEFYQHGSVAELYNRMQTQTYDLQLIVFKANQLWCKRDILPAIKTLKPDDKPICVAVGAAHLLGSKGKAEETSINKILRDLGFEVTRIEDVVVEEK